MIRNVAIVGVGLIGASLGLGLQDNNQIENVVGIDQDPRHLQQALDINAIDREADLKAGVKDADLVIVAVPVGSIEKVVEQVLLHTKSGTIITDVGSTKSDLVSKLEQKAVDKDCSYIGGHPMTGSEISGPIAADKYLFENAIYVLTKTEKTDRASLKELKSLVEELEAQTLILSPTEHDQTVAVTSHLPHLVAVNLMQVVAEYEGDDDLISSLIAGGFRDTTRIAAGDPEMWKDIFLKNRELILNAVDVFEDKLAEFKEIIVTADGADLEDNLAQIRQARRELPMKKKGLLATNFELILTLKDEPNAIGKATTLIGRAGINIQDIEVLKVRDDGGTIRLSFKQEEEQEDAYRILKENEYKLIKK